MTKLVLAEKPKVASKIAESFGDYETEKHHGVTNYHVSVKNQNLIISPAVGHIFNLEDTSEEWSYPVLESEWKPIFEVNDSAGYVKKYYRNLEKISSKCEEYVNACDYDLEGSVIGYTVLTRIAEVPPSKISRMKFSTLTKSDLQESFDQIEEFDSGMAYAGVARHKLDFYYGVNLSRALMKSVQENDRYEKLSTGRVQGPALKLLAEREREIQDFDPETYWEMYVETPQGRAQWQDGDQDRIWQESRKDSLKQKVASADKAEVVEVNRNRYKHKPPKPFNLTGLQKEASSQINLSPKQAQSAAQDLYEKGLISYPRTESQKLPPKIGYKSILNGLKNLEFEEGEVSRIMQKDKRYTTQGKKKDDAHPAIYPTGETPEGGLSSKQKRLYKLIVKRFFAVFGDAAERESVSTKFDIQGEVFSSKSKYTVEENWYNLYRPFVNVSDDDKPGFSEGQVLAVQDVENPEKQTKPPNRYSKSRVVSEMEKRRLGTKATRAETVQSLYNRDFIDGGRIEVTTLGMAIVRALEDYCPEILSEQLTRDFEQEMEEIKRGGKSHDEVIESAKSKLEDVLLNFKQHQADIGSELVDAIDERRDEKRTLGECGECGEGQLKVIKTSGSTFVGCTSYPDCENTYPLPNTGSVESKDSKCDECGKPEIFVKRKKKSSYSMCVDPDCPSKDDW